MYLEFFGHSASGKTTIRKILEEKYKFKHHDNKIYFNFTALIKSFISLVNPAFTLLKNHVFDIILIKNIFLKYYFYHSFSGENYVTDHGFIQTYFCSKKLVKKLSKKPLIISKLFLFLPIKNSKYVFFNIEKKKALLREGKRGKFKIQRKKLARYDEMEWLLKLAFDSIKKQKVEFLSIDVSKSKSMITKNILKSS